MMPGALATPIEVHIDGVDFCYGATSHPSGVVALGTLPVSNGGGDTRFPYSAAGAALGPAMGPLQNNGGDADTWFHPLTAPDGWRGVGLDGHILTWDPAGHPTGDLALGAFTITPLPDGAGSVVVVPGPPPSSSSPAGTTELTWVDAAGVAFRTVLLDQDPFRAIVDWDNGHLFALLGGLSSRPTQGRWFDRDGVALTDWFVIPVGKGSGGSEHLLGGGLVAFGTVGGPWLLALRDGVAGTEPAPGWLAARPSTRLATIRGGRGFAVMPATGIGLLELVTTAGESCGTVALPPPDAAAGTVPSFPPPRLDVGWDGTVFQSVLVQVPGQPSPLRCVFRWWPALLR